MVHEQYWTAQAKFSDIVLPATTVLERNDIGSGSHDGFMVAMRQHIAPFAGARDDYAIFLTWPHGLVLQINSPKGVIRNSG